MHLLGCSCKEHTKDHAGDPPTGGPLTPPLHGTLSYTDLAGEPLVLKPDADVTLAVGDWEQHWFIEVDLATESRTRISSTAREYVEYLGSGVEQAKRGVTPHVAFLVPSVVLDAVHQVNVKHWRLFAAACQVDAVALLSGDTTEVQE